MEFIVALTTKMDTDYSNKYYGTQIYEYQALHGIGTLLQ